MKKLLPLLLFAVVSMLFSCEKHEPTAVKVQFVNMEETLTTESELTVKIQLNLPAPENLTIPFEITGEAIDNIDFQIVDQTDNLFTISKGQTEATIKLKHLERNGSAKNVFLKIKSGTGYDLGENYICEITVAPREPYYISFTAKTIQGREFSTVLVNVQLSHRDATIPFEAPEDLTISLFSIPDYYSNVTNVSKVTYAWIYSDEEYENSNYNSYYKDIVVPIGANSASARMRISYANEYLPSGNDPQYKFGITVGDQRYLAMNGFALRSSIDPTAIDTTYVMIDRIQNPVNEFLVNKKLANPTLSFQQPWSNVALFNETMAQSGENVSLLPSKTDPNDGLSFYANVNNNPNNDPTYKVNLTAGSNSDFRLFFRNYDKVSFISYTTVGTPFMLGTRGSAPCFSLKMKGNKLFYATKEDISENLEVFFIPAAMSQTDFDAPANYIDVIIPSESYIRDRSDIQPHFFKILQASSVPRSYLNVWYRTFPTAAE